MLRNDSDNFEVKNSTACALIILKLHINTFCNAADGAMGRTFDNAARGQGSIPYTCGQVLLFHGFWFS